MIHPDRRRLRPRPPAGRRPPTRAQARSRCPPRRGRRCSTPSPAAPSGSSPAPAAPASALRRSLLDKPLNTKSAILDIGYADTIPDAIRKAVIARDKGCAWPGGCHRRPAHCDVHHVKHNTPRRQDQQPPTASCCASTTTTSASTASAGTSSSCPTDPPAPPAPTANSSSAATDHHQPPNRPDNPRPNPARHAQPARDRQQHHIGRGAHSTPSPTTGFVLPRRSDVKIRDGTAVHRRSAGGEAERQAANRRPGAPRGGTARVAATISVKNDAPQGVSQAMCGQPPSTSSTAPARLRATH